MKKNFLLFLLIGLVFNTGTGNAQLQKGNLLIGSDIMSISGSVGEMNYFNIGIAPKLGYFIKDNFTVGAESKLYFYDIHNISYELGAFTRYYFSSSEIEPLLKHGRFFGEADMSFAGYNGSPLSFLFEVGPGYSYFISPHVGLEGLLKLFVSNLPSGSSLGFYFSVGFQIYLPTKKVKSIIKTESGY